MFCVTPPLLNICFHSIDGTCLLLKRYNDGFTWLIFELVLITNIISREKMDLLFWSLPLQSIFLDTFTSSDTSVFFCPFFISLWFFIPSFLLALNRECLAICIAFFPVLPLFPDVIARSLFLWFFHSLLIFLISSNIRCWYCCHGRSAIVRR